MLGVPQDQVRLEPYDERWPAQFAGERERLLRGLGVLARDLQHFGSTAVPGLPAKPILDIAIQMQTFAALPDLVGRLAALGYQHKGEHGLSGRQFFTRGDPVTHHVHVVEEGSPHWADWLRFRDLLRADPAAREAYAACKRDLAQRHAADRKAYTREKNPFIARLMGRST
jgi:GrpB-like predicted nucleotidyltransferase (UPF0157 family)